MPRENHTIYCTAQALDGKGGVHKIGDKLVLASKAEASQLLATGRFSLDEDDAKAASSKKSKKAPSKKTAAS